MHALIIPKINLILINCSSRSNKKEESKCHSNDCSTLCHSISAQFLLPTYSSKDLPHWYHSCLALPNWMTPSTSITNWIWRRLLQRPGLSHLVSDLYMTLPRLFPSNQIKITWALSYMKSGRAAKWAARVFKWEEDHERYSKFLDWDVFHQLQATQYPWTLMLDGRKILSLRHAIDATRPDTKPWTVYWSST